jgi:hypothetical protein
MRRRSGDGLPEALLTLSATTGEVHATTSTDRHGRYRLRLPSPGHHILTLLDPDETTTLSVKIFTTTQSAQNDLELPVS